MKKFAGIYPAFCACYDDSGEVSTERIKEYVRFLIEKGVQGVYVCGSTGECIYLSVAERKQTLEAVMEETRGKLQVIAHVAANNTRDSAELAAHAESLGVDAIAAIPPIYFKLPEKAIAAYWNAMSAAAPNTDFIIYNVPQLAGVALTPALLKEMLKNPRVIGVKNTSLPTQDILTWKAIGGEEFTVFNGPDEQLVSGIAIGASAGIGSTYSAMPELYVAMYQAIQANAWDKARRIQYACNEGISRLFGTDAHLMAAIKEVVRLRFDLDLGGVREPLTNLTEADKPALRECAAFIDHAVAELCH